MMPAPTTPAIPLPPDGAPIEILCPAKLNLALCVGPPAADGFHPLASAMLALAWGDRLLLTKSEATRWRRAWAIDAPKPTAIDWPEEKDLGCRAHRLLEQATGRALPVEVQLDKRIPTGAGLGGGSSNAAGVLVGLNRLFDLRLPVEKLCDLAGELGSDAPFFVRALCGQTLCLATGRGEKLKPIALPACWQEAYFALLFPHAACSTPAVYSAFDALAQFGAPEQTGLQRVQTVALGAGPCFNDLTAAACQVAPEVRVMLAQLQGMGLAPQVTGSGSCVFVVGASYGAADQAASSMRAAMDVPTRVVRALR